MTLQARRRLMELCSGGWTGTSGACIGDEGRRDGLEGNAHASAELIICHNVVIAQVLGKQVRRRGAKGPRVPLFVGGDEADIGWLDGPSRSLLCILSARQRLCTAWPAPPLPMWSARTCRQRRLSFPLSSADRFLEPELRVVLVMAFVGVVAT